jgi:predicted nucleic acid-binding protein
MPSWQPNGARSLILIVDSNVLITAVNDRDPDHQAVLATLSSPGNELVIPALCLTEACFLIERDHGSMVEARFLQSMRSLHIECPTELDLRRMSELVIQYRDFLLGAVDASVIAVAERLNATRIATLDRRHFAVVRPGHVASFELLP